MLLQACPYYTMFPLEFPLAWLRDARPGEWVLDPFCGRGTTLYAARLRGLPAAGADVSPVAAAIAEAMLAAAPPEAVLEPARRILQRVTEADLPEGEFWEWAYHRETLQVLCRLREGLRRDAGKPAARLLRAVLLGRLHGPLRKGMPSYLSNQMPRTYAPKPAYALRFWRSRGLRPPEVDPLELLARTLPRLLQDLPPPVPGAVACGDARAVDFRALGGPYDWVITSPPYWGMRTYVPDQWLRHWFLGGPPRVAYAYQGQIGRSSAENYAAALRQVWIRVAQACRPGARLVVRFGALPSRRGPDPLELLQASLRDTPWQIQWVRAAGSSDRGRRQARGFLESPLPAVREMDVLARWVE